MSDAPRHRREAPAGGWSRGPVLAAASAVLTVLLVVGLLFRDEDDDTPATGGADEAGTSEPPATAEVPAPSASSPAGSTGPAAPTDAAPQAAEAAFDTDRFSVDDPASPWVVVNKSRPLNPLDHRPATVTVHGHPVAEQAAEPLGALVAAARADGVELAVTSGFRSYERQAQVHGDLVTQRGREGAEAVSARPGHSEHQTGLAVDVIDQGARQCDLRPCFADTPAGRWVAENGWQHGWIVRYRAGHEAVTGYAPEAWHLRYVGAELAAELRAQGYPTLEAFFGLPGGDYPAAPGSAGAG